ncbi:immunoglobulin-like domain-containing protein, partial [Alkalihalobacillus hemicellulosilyticus]|uniref:immunoglobulin-like domain-containing protein n=1 Tax=Halalkalibacter hemicellulosilyticus TaxID=127886 RepID=UPI0015632952
MAPEAFYDPNTGDYVVFWASSMKNEDTYGDYPNGRPAGQYNVMYYATTRDFHTFSEPKVFIDDGFPTIDTTFIEHDDTLYRFTKSEVNFRVYYEKASHIFYDADGIEENGFQFDLIEGTRDGNRGLIGHQGNNEGQTVFKDIHEEKWYLFLDSWPYHVRWSDNLEDGQQFVDNLLPTSDYALPPGPRHGTVIPITRDEYDLVQEHYAIPGPTPVEEPVVRYSFNPNDVEGTTVKDVSGNGFDARLQGGATITTDDTIESSSGAVELDGDTGYVELPENLIQDLNLESMTMSTWVKVKGNQTNQRIFDFASDTGRIVNRNTMYLSTQGDSNQLEFAVITPFTEKFSNEQTPLANNYKYALNAQRLPINHWQHVAITIDGFDAVLYVNGEEVFRSSTYNVEPRMLMETTMNYLGKSRRDVHPHFNGLFDEFHIYNRALSSEEIIKLADEDVSIPIEEPESNLILHYDMANIDEVTVPDQTGSYDGQWVNRERGDWIQGNQAGAINFQGGDVQSYIELPEGIVDGLDSMTVSSLVNWKGDREAEWIFALGQDDQKYFFATPSRNSGDRSARIGLGITSWQNEAHANAITGPLTANDWKLVTAVMDGMEESLTLYIDGEEVASGSTNGYTLEEIANVSGPSGFIGRSFYSSDPYFGGMVADFRIYEGALSSDDVEKLSVESAAKVEDLKGFLVEHVANQIDFSDILANNLNEEEVMYSLSLPSEGAYGMTFTWESSDSTVITNEGIVIRPSYEEGDREVTLSLTVSDGIQSVEKSFTVKVLRLPSEYEALIDDARALYIHHIRDVRGHLTLPTSGENGSKMTWHSDNPEIISESGEVTRPAHGEGDQQVKLIATITKGEEMIMKGFLATVRELPKQEELEGYLFSYMKGEGRSDGEQIYFALSEGNDPLHYYDLNDDQPVITSQLGDQGVRDPFIIRAPEGDRFYMIATDLKIYGNWDWHRAQTNGSRSIMVWESNDLINWSEQRMVEVAPPEAGNTWAPEIFYDDEKGEYVIFWASKLYEDEAHRQTGATHNRMMYTTTRDFYSFSEPDIYIDRGYSIIDTTMIEHEGQIYRFSKDERNNSSQAPNGKYIFQEVGDSIFDSGFDMIREGVGRPDVGHTEGPIIFKSNKEEKWYLFVDEFGGRGYVPLESTDLDSGEWSVPSSYTFPENARHGSVLPITSSEYENLQTTLPRIQESNDVAITSIELDESDVTINVGEEALLHAHIYPDNATNQQVVWTSNDPAIVEINDEGEIVGIEAGTATITVTTVDGGLMAIAYVHVIEQSGEEPPPGGEEPPPGETSPQVR